MISVICSFDRLFCPKTLIFLPFIVSVCLSLSKYLALNSSKSLNYLSLIVKSSSILFAQVNCCFSPVIWNLIASAILFSEERVQSNFPKNWVCLHGFAHVYYRNCIKKSSHLGVKYKKFPFNQNPVFMQARFHLAGMIFFHMTQT